MEDQITILSVGMPYDIAAENGTHVTGCTMWYVMDGELNKTEADDGTLGYNPVKEKMPVDFYARAQAVGIPCKAKVVYGNKSSGGKVTLFIKGLDFITEGEKKAK